MRRIAAVLIVLMVAACDPFKAIGEAAKNGPIAPLPTVIIWSGNDGNKGHSLQMSFDQSGNSLSGNGELYDFSVYPSLLHNFSISGSYTGTPSAGTVDMVFTSKTTPVISFKAVQDGDKMVGTLVGGLFGSGTDVTLSKTVR